MEDKTAAAAEGTAGAGSSAELQSGQGQGSSSPTNERKGKKIYFPFGSPIRHAFSDFCHLSGDTRAFAMNIAMSQGIEETIKSNSERQKAVDARKKFAEKFPALPAVPSHHHHGSSSDEPPCTKKACQEVIRAILDLQTTHKLEQDEIQTQFEKLAIELEEQEATNNELETKFLQLGINGNQLQVTLDHIKLELDKMEKTNHDLVLERDSFNSKFQALELERQLMLRELSEASADLYATLWGTDQRQGSFMSDRRQGGSKLPELQLKRLTAAEVERDSNAATTDYNSLARAEIVDVGELSLNRHTLPRFLENRLLLPAMEEGRQPAFFTLSKRGRQDGQQLSKTEAVHVRRWPHSSPGHKHYSLRMPLTLRSSGSGTDGRSVLDLLGSSQTVESRTRNILKTIRQGSPHLKLKGGSYKGYSPTGSPTRRAASPLRDRSQFDGDQRSIFSSRSFERSIKQTVRQPLDPVFFRESARTAAYRGSSVGQVRRQPEEKKATGRNGASQGQLLTVRHPGLAMAAVETLGSLALGELSSSPPNSAGSQYSP